jgi:hypothetical protein
MICQFEPNEHYNKIGKQTNTLSKRETTQTPHKDGKSHERRTKTTKYRIKQTKENFNLCENHLFRIKRGKYMHRGDSRSKNDQNHPLFEARRRKLLRKKLGPAHQEKEKKK